MRNYLYLIVTVIFLPISCKDQTKKIEKVPTTEVTEEVHLSGNYVSEGYLKRSEGYDWVAVSVRETEIDLLTISIRSRADRKKPTCTLDAVARKVDNRTYETQIDGKTIQFKFTNDEISIDTKIKEEGDLLFFYCSGGGSIGGTYSKISEPLDQTQIDKTKFISVLNLQNLGFYILSIEKDGKNTFTISTFGLKEREYDETFNIEGEEIISAKVKDINVDGSPELFIFSKSIGSGRYGNVYAFSVNNMKSMSEVYFQPTSENNKINEGYMGHDEFSIVENTLMQCFPIYKEGDSNAKPTGGTRQVSYRLVEGEAMRKLEVDQIIEF